MIIIRKKYLLPLLCSSVLLTGACTMAPTYEQPALSVAETWQDIPGYPTKEGEVAADKLQWQNFFASKQLHQVIETAIENNKDLKTAVLNVQEARALYRIERADLMPSIDAGGSATYTKTTDESSSTGNGTRTDAFEANIGATSYELDLFGRVRSLNESALNEYFATEQAQRAVHNSLIAETANAYLQLLADQKLLALTEKTLEAQEKTYGLLSESLDKGVSTEQDVARAATAVETARVNLHHYRRYVAQDKNALILLMGIKHDDKQIPEAKLEELAIKDNLDPQIPSQVLLSRPDVRQAEFELMARNANIGAARAAFFPSITLTGSFGNASTALSKLFTSGAAGAWSFIPQITLPIFHGGENIANLELAEIRKDQAILNYEKTTQEAFSEVADSLAAKATLEEQLKAQKRLVAAAQKVYDISNERYKSGIDSFLSVLDSQRELYTYQQNEIQTERERLANLVTLYKVLGGGTVR